MDDKSSSNIIIAIYKGYKRYKVFNVSQRLLTWIVVINSALIIGCLIFFISFTFQWAYNWKLSEENKTLQKEILQLKK
ncbi:MAG: hypothetical protein WCQ53_06730 [bacterium]